MRLNDFSNRLMQMNYWRYHWLLFVSVAAIIVGPYFMLREVYQRIHAAEQLVVHVGMTDTLLNQLLHEAGNLESAAATIAAGVDTPIVRRRVAESSARIPELMRSLGELATDNPQQQLQIGALKSRIDQRMQVGLRIAGSLEPEERKRLLDLMVNEMPVRSLAAEVQKEGLYLLDTRRDEARALARRGEWIAVGSMLMQLALLMLLLWNLRRQQRQRERAEHDVITANARALAVMQSIREPIALLDREQRVVMHNAAFAELYADEQAGSGMEGQAIEAIGGDAWQGRALNQRLRDVISRGRELWDFEIEQTTADGIQRSMLLNASRMSLPGREDEVALLTVSDISHRKAAAQEISELNRQLQGKIEQISDVNRELEAFSYSVSHDLRSPLRHISGFADKLERHLGEAADEKTRHYLGIIDGSAKRMAALIDDLLVYSRLGRSALRLQPVDMQSLVEETRALLDANTRNEAPERRIEWKIEPLPIVIADDNMMRQVWLNLLGNAVKYSAPRALAHIHVGYRRLNDGRHEFSVRDDGVGFDMAYAGKLFGVFQRMHKASEFPGTGIGLANVQRVLMRHGGQITAEAAPGEGATFRFTLPAMLDAPPPAPKEIA